MLKATNNVEALKCYTHTKLKQYAACSSMPIQHPELFVPPQKCLKSCSWSKGLYRLRPL